MTQKKIIAVIGATGKQGGGLARAILNDPNGEFSVRVVTRDPDSEEAKKLEILGAEIIKADIGDEGSLEKAFEGAYGAFLVSFFWHHCDTDRDLKEIKNMAVAVKNAGLQHVIYSTLEDTRDFIPVGERLPVTHDKYNAAHMDVKGEGDHFFTDLGVPVTFFLTTFYFENFFNPGTGPTKQNGVLALTLPMEDKALAAIASEDIGKCAYGVFKKGKEYIGKKVGVSGDQLKIKEYAAVLSEVTGEKIVYAPQTHDEHRAANDMFGNDSGNSFQFMCEFNKEFLAARSLEFSRSVNPELQSFEQWAKANKDSIYLDKQV